MRWGERDYHASEVKEGMDREYVDWWVNLCRLAASPGAAAHYLRMVQETDVSDIVSAVHVPALVFYGSYGDVAWDLGQQEFGQLLRNAQMVRVSEFASPWHVPELIPELRRFLADHERGDVPDSVLTTLLFTDIVRSTERTAAVGDRHGATFSQRTNKLRDERSQGSEAANSTPPAMASSPRSTAPPARSNARRRS
jgi:hypothetical protein